MRKLDFKKEKIGSRNFKIHKSSQPHITTKKTTHSPHSPTPPTESFKLNYVRVRETVYLVVTNILPSSESTKLCHRFEFPWTSTRILHCSHVSSSPSTPCSPDRARILYNATHESKRTSGVYLIFLCMQRGMYVERASMTSATWPMFPLIQAVLLRHSSGH